MIVNKAGQQIFTNDLSHQDTIDNQCDIVTHQHGRDKLVRVLEKDRKDAGSNAPFAFHFKTQFVYRHKGNLHS